MNIAASGRGQSAAAAVARLLDRPGLRRLVELAHEAAGNEPGHKLLAEHARPIRSPRPSHPRPPRGRDGIIGAAG